MKHFIITITYTTSFDKIEKILPEHRAYLQEAVDRGFLLLSGPQEPRTGGIVIARANSSEDVAKFVAGDPYKRNNFADYKWIEFVPGRHQDFLKDWLTKE